MTNPAYLNSFLEQAVPTFVATEPPRYEHNCSSCLYLGVEGEYDLYFCLGSKSVVARYGNAGPEYTSDQARFVHARGSLCPQLVTATFRMRGLIQALEHGLTGEDPE